MSGSARAAIAMLEEVKAALSTVVGITVTPFDESGAVDAEGYRRLVRRVVDGGITALTPNGNTSEFYSLTPTERDLAVRITMDEAPHALVLPGVGGSLESIIDDAGRLAALGVRAVMVHQPVHPFWSDSGWVDLHRTIAQALPDLGIVPYLRSERVSVTALRELLGACPNVVAVKYAVADPGAFAECVAAIGTERLTWICGLAEMWAPFFAIAGASGFTSGLVSVDPARSLRMLRALQDADYPSAMQQWAQLREFEDLRARRGSELNVSVVKQALSELGLCRPAVRAPLSPLGAQERAVVRRIVGEWGLLSSSGNN